MGLKVKVRQFTLLLKAHYNCMAPCPCCFAAQLQAVYDPVVSQPKQASEKPAKELGKGKQKAPDAMQGSAKKPKTRFENLVENAQRWRRTHGLSMEVNKANKKRWMATVSAWFEERKALLAFLAQTLLCSSRLANGTFPASVLARAGVCNGALAAGLQRRTYSHAESREKQTDTALLRPGNRRPAGHSAPAGWPLSRSPARRLAARTASPKSPCESGS